MTDDDRQDFAQCFVAMSVLYNAPADEAVMEMAFGALKRFELADVKEAMNRTVATADRRPTPAELAQDIRAVRIKRHLETQAREALAPPDPNGPPLESQLRLISRLAGPDDRLPSSLRTKAEADDLLRALMKNWCNSIAPSSR